MMTGPLLGSILYAFGGYQLPFFVTGLFLFIFLLISLLVLPSTPLELEKSLTPKLTP